MPSFALPRLHSLLLVISGGIQIDKSDVMYSELNSLITFPNCNFITGDTYIVENCDEFTELSYSIMWGTSCAAYYKTNWKVVCLPESYEIHEFYLEVHVLSNSVWWYLVNQLSLFGAKSLSKSLIIIAPTFGWVNKP